MSVLAAIAVIALLVAVHEAGHFLAARLQGIHVNRFAIGFGPILWKFQGAETEYSLRAIPLGGVCGLPG
jgi:RIP metalloprotease RseP